MPEKFDRALPLILSPDTVLWKMQHHPQLGGYYSLTQQWWSPQVGAWGSEPSYESLTADELGDVLVAEASLGPFRGRSPWGSSA